MIQLSQVIDLLSFIWLYGLRLYGYAEYSVTSVKAKRPYNHITLKPKKLKLAKLQ